jgi:hypothetical protein
MKGRDQAGAAASPEERARRALKGVVGDLERAARELALAGKIVRDRTGSIGAEGVLSLEVSDVAHRIRDLDTGRPSPEPYPSERSQAPARKRPIEILLGHLDSALRCLLAAAKATHSYLEEKTRGEAGVLVEEVADVTHRAEGVAERRRRERDTETGQLFETLDEPEAPRRGLLKWFFGGLRDG